MPRPGSAEERADAARRAQLLRYTQLQRAQRDAVIATLNAALVEILKVLSGAPSDWQRYRLAEIQKSIDASITRWTARQAGAWTDGVNSAWQMGQDLVNAPYAAAGIPTTFNAVDDRMLLSMRTFLTRKIADISDAQRSAITAALNLGATGGITREQVTQRIAAQFNGDRRRALTITRTELGRANSAATWLRLKQAAENDPLIRKQWRRSGKRLSRHTHDFADGQIKPVMEFFLIGGEKLMYPRDPTASPKNTINCGCTMLPSRANWQVANPGAQPFSDAELLAVPSRADIQQILQERPRS